MSGSANLLSIASFANGGATEIGSVFASQVEVSSRETPSLPLPPHTSPLYPPPSPSSPCFNQLPPYGDLFILRNMGGTYMYVGIPADCTWFETFDHACLEYKWKAAAPFEICCACGGGTRSGPTPPPNLPQTLMFQPSPPFTPRPMGPLTSPLPTPKSLPNSAPISPPLDSSLTLLSYRPTIQNETYEAALPALKARQPYEDLLTFTSTVVGIICGFACFCCLGLCFYRWRQQRQRAQRALRITGSNPLHRTGSFRPRKHAQIHVLHIIGSRRRFSNKERKCAQLHQLHRTERIGRTQNTSALNASAKAVHRSCTPLTASNSPKQYTASRDSSAHTSRDSSSSHSIASDLLEQVRAALLEVGIASEVTPTLRARASVLNGELLPIPLIRCTPLAHRASPQPQDSDTILALAQSPKLAQTEFSHRSWTPALRTASQSLDLARSLLLFEEAHSHQSTDISKHDAIST
eukprot:CAMPEP_0119302820 /NCGR_PEP_ID=MMETSP1333-20130426/4356_1 /TAXON_ID=418940 /ORGANISM="Scyphosphaera apsteinii, Strain RCC1455" /LENGTH=464 /DNA_ID=CAMNT_0007305297 /DNA_START=98 /DNA_END=1489 /DNA_ORIENTATION=+